MLTHISDQFWTVRSRKTSIAGEYVSIGKDLRAFVPDLLPPEIQFDLGVIRALSDADRAVGALSRLGELLPNPQLLITPFTRKEAVASSKIEGIQADFGQLALFEELGRDAESSDDVREVGNYVEALEYGLSAIQYRPVGMSLLKELHAVLMTNVRGGQKGPGEIRTIQNFIGSSLQRIDQARFIPPPLIVLTDLLENLEQYIQEQEETPPLIRLAVAHYQFEAIHPFLDGNGRLGRLLVSLLLGQWGLLPQPFLYLSEYFDRHRDHYIDGLLKVSTDRAWNDWIIFFLNAVTSQSRDALTRGRRLNNLRESYRLTYQQRRSARILQTVDLLFERPVVSGRRLATGLGVAHQTAMAIIRKLEDDDVLIEITGKYRNRVYVATEIFTVITADMTSGPTADHARDGNTVP